MIRVLCLTLGAAMLIAAGPADDPQAYRVRIAVTPAGGAPVQRLTIPAAALVAAQTADLSDLRVFDARGRAMPIARVPAGGTRRDRLAAMPILGAADALTVKRVSLRIDDRGQARAVQLDGTPAEPDERAIVLGALLDARAIGGAARALALDISVPVAQPVTFTVEASRDLSAWRVVGEKVVYRASAGGGADATIALSTTLDREYLKVTWRLGSRPLSPVIVRGATLLTRPDGRAAAAYAEATLPPLRDARDGTVAVPFRTPIASIAIRPRGDDLVVPVRVSGRDDAEAPWTPLGQGIASAGGAAITLRGGPYRMLRIAADARTPGFTTPPSLRLGFAAGDLLFLAAGRAPFTLAAGREGVAGAYLAPDTLLAQGAGRPAGLATMTAPPARVALTDMADARFGGTRLALWAILLGATGVLALLARLLWKRGV